MLKKNLAGLLTVFVLLVGCTEEEAIPRVAENSFELQSARAKDDNPGQSQKDRDKSEVKGCTRTIGFWKNHPDVLSPLLPVWLGDENGMASVEVTNAEQAYEILDFNSGNGILKLYAQMLATKLNILSEAPETPVADAISEADAFLSENAPESWDELSEEDQQMVLDWKTIFDDYNNGLTEAPHCDNMNENAQGETEEETPEEDPMEGSNDGSSNGTGGSTDGSGSDDEEESV